MSVSGSSTVHALYRPLGLVACVLNIRIWGHRLTCNISYCSMPKKADLGGGGGVWVIWTAWALSSLVPARDDFVKFLVVHPMPSLITGFVCATGKPLEIATILKSPHLIALINISSFVYRFNIFGSFSSVLKVSIFHQMDYIPERKLPLSSSWLDP